MRSIAFAALAACVLAGCSPAEDRKEAPKPATPEERKDEMKSIIQDFVETRQKAVQAMRTAKSDQERKAAEALLPKEDKFLPRVLVLIEGGADDAAAAEALTFAVIGLNSTDQRITAALDAKFIKTEKIKKFIEMSLQGAPDAAKPVLEKVVKENPDRTLKGMSLYALATLAFEKDDEKAKKEAEGYFARIEKEFADVKVGRGDKLGEMAKGYLNEIRHLQIGMTAPAAESKDLSGKKATLADLKGKVVVLDFWATWCGPCKAMIPHEREMVEKFKDKPFTFVSISADSEKAELEDFLKTEKMPWTHWWDGADSALLKGWNIRFYPSIYVIDAKGVIRHKHIRGEELEKAIEKLIAEAKK